VAGSTRCSCPARTCGTLDLIEEIETETGLPVMSSNTVLAWHLARLAGLAPAGPGRLAQAG
jgi:maleate isomerase